MAEIAFENGAVVIDFDDGEWSSDGCLPAEQRRDVLFAAAIARHGATSLERIAAMSIASGITILDSGPSVEVYCVIHNHKPLVRWQLGRWVKRLQLSAVRAVALAKETRAAANEAERRCRWLELEQPACFVR